MKSCKVAEPLLYETKCMVLNGYVPHILCKTTYVRYHFNFLTAPFEIKNGGHTGFIFYYCINNLLSTCRVQNLLYLFSLMKEKANLGGQHHRLHLKVRSLSSERLSEFPRVSQLVKGSQN